MVGIFVFTFYTYLLLFSNLIFALGLGLLINVYLFNFLRKLLKNGYFLFCNIVALSGSIAITIISAKFLSSEGLVLILEALTLIGVTIYSIPLFVEYSYKKNIYYYTKVEDVKQIKDNIKFFYRANIFVWLFYVVAVIVNILNKLDVINVVDKDLIFIFESSEGVVIIYFAIVALIEVIKRCNIINKKIITEQKNRD